MYVSGDCKKILLDVCYLQCYRREKYTQSGLNVGFDWNYLIGFYIFDWAIGLDLNIVFDIGLIVFYVFHSQKFSITYFYVCKHILGSIKLYI